MTTLNPAEFLGRTGTMGSIEIGKNADIVLLDGNPVESVQNLHTLSGVVRAGFYYSHTDLEALRPRAKEARHDVEISDKVQPAQFAALQEWGLPVGERFAYLKNIIIPVLVVGGKSDIIFYTINSFYLEQNLPNAQLIVYPDAAHGSLFQYPELFVEHTNIFLRS
jgi:pimeloyl-ACP methyl ester carboxylesterase